jgi:GTPase SAR1 family protein
MNRTVSQDEVKSFASKYKMAYIETSANLNTNISKAFEEIVKILLNNAQNHHLTMKKKKKII